VRNVNPEQLATSGSPTKHKAFVLRAGLKTGAPIWRLVIHDWSKFTPAEAPHYGRQFFGARDDPEGFARAWLHHQNANPHHWEFWISRSGHERLIAHNGALADAHVGRARDGGRTGWVPHVPTAASGRVTGSRGSGCRTTSAPRCCRVSTPRRARTSYDVLTVVLGKCEACHGNGYATWPSGGFTYELDCPYCIGEPYLRKVATEDERATTAL